MEMQFRTFAGIYNYFFLYPNSMKKKMGKSEKSSILKLSPKKKIFLSFLKHMLCAIKEW